jgi:hypothetical protein
LEEHIASIIREDKEAVQETSKQKYMKFMVSIFQDKQLFCMFTQIVTTGI